jgi:predicted NBD/HSP70 family sugar kinase
MILAADIGRTVAHLGLFDAGGSRLLRAQTFHIGEGDSVADLVGRFLDSAGEPRVDAACIGIGFPRAVLAHELAEVFEIPAVLVVDGVEARVLWLRDLARLAVESITCPRGRKRCPSHVSRVPTPIST